MRSVTYLAVAILAFLVGCGEITPTSYRDAEPAVKSSAGGLRIQPTAPPIAQFGVTSIPDDVTYTIIKKNILPGIKRDLDIRLNRKVSKDVLTAIGMKLKNADPNAYNQTFICYYLADMKVGSGAWATTHFTPNLEVKILGLTAEQEKALKQPPPDSEREMIGCWLDETSFGGSQITIFRKDRKLFMETKYKDGSVGTFELAETSSKHGRRFNYKPDRGHGDYYLINSKGELQEFDQNGPFMTAKKVK